jgi:hypothetical protein
MDDMPPRRRLGCWGWLLILTGLVGVMAIGVAFWLNSDRDLRAEAARAQSLGVPMEWRDLPVVRPEPADMILLRLLQKTTERGITCAAADNGWWSWDPFETPPAALATWDSGIDVDMDALVVQLSCTPAWSLDAAAMEDAGRRGDVRAMLAGMSPHDGDLRDAARELLIQRSGRGSDAPAHLAVLFANLAATPASVSFNDHQKSLGIARDLANHVIRHRDRLDPNITAQTAQLLADRLDAMLPAVISSHPLYMAAMLHADPWQFMRQWNVRLVALMELPGGLRFFHRLGRRVIVARGVDAAAWVAAHGIPRTYRDVTSAAPQLPPMSSVLDVRSVFAHTLEYHESLHYRQPGTFDPYLLLYLHLLSTTQLRLVAADLAGSPWPLDPWDPGGAPIRRIVHDGVVIGGYSCWLNGLDDGGGRGDLCWPLRAKPGSPKASDPLPKP